MIRNGETGEEERRVARTAAVSGGGRARGIADGKVNQAIIQNETAVHESGSEGGGDRRYS